MGNEPSMWAVVLVAFNILLLLVSFFGAWVLNGIKESIKSLQVSDASHAQDISTLKESLPENYVLRREYTEHKQELRQFITELRDDVRNGFERVFEKLDRKADKNGQ